MKAEAEEDWGGQSYSSAMNPWLDFALEIPTSGFTHYSCRGLRPIAPSHGENRGSSPLGSANEIKELLQDRRLVSNSCPINVYGQAWTDRKLVMRAVPPHSSTGEMVSVSRQSPRTTQSKSAGTHEHIIINGAAQHAAATGV